MATAKKITIHDVALAAGVSVSTVSLVLSGKGESLPPQENALTPPLKSWDLCAIVRRRRCAAGKAASLV